ncbi:MAG: hypothetical protein CVV64_02430 [Candidatus Wallbacteria bacterium HGW-Wallbacteria-1]|jgi:radical SAM protein with 4Fe4S-binding SPASM domain|uniref:Radical SAM core domain-containing protein n=1 Tax=Candidatus Wallbacteria bacterium HGW-Wallbacteria-1 TaxID=2013854 RepID=A0A2N1PVC6_9BACT|nr:MAG: hypothetical protein CVV64_02430 [Candidatus Wallbacteria bacterium HGW-Wallbacteria-1]
MREHFTDPFFLQWHVTDRCNLKCRHCYRDESRVDLDLETQKGFLEQFRELVAFTGRGGRIQFAGGEPLLFEGLEELIFLAEAQGFPTRILSSGVLLDSSRAQSLRKAGLRIVQISIEGTREIHDSIRGEGNFDRALEGAVNARNAGLEVTFSMTVSRENQHCINEVFNLAQKYADRVGFHRIIVAGQARNIGDAMLSPSEWKGVLARINKLRRGAGIDVPFRDPLWTPFLTSRFFARIARNVISGCSAGFNQLTLDSDGTVYPCRRLPIELGNITHGTLLQIWRESEVIARLRDRSLLKGKCGKCKLKYLCGGCRAVPYATHGDYLDQDPQCFW